MCQRVSCSKCGKPSYEGCGRHIEAVLGDVPREARCRCREEKAGARTGKESRGSGFFSFFRRSSEDVR